MNYVLDIDPADVLGVADGATLQEIHDAYRARVKKHHPDVGGDEWAFRIVTRAYEFLYNARLRSRVSGDWPWADPVEEPELRDEPHAQPAPPPRHSPPPPPDHESSWVRVGVEDRVNHPAKLVDVELFTIRFELDSAFHLLEPAKDRNLSSCLNVTWPAQPQHDADPEIAPDPTIQKLLKRVFATMPKRTKAISSWSKISHGLFIGWMSFPSANLAGEAFEVFHRVLNENGLGVRQLTRELFLAREAR